MLTSTPLTLSDDERAELEGLARSRRGRADESRRARIMLLLADGYSYTAICERVDCTAQTIATWKARYETEGVAGLRGRHGRHAAPPFCRDLLGAGDLHVRQRPCTEAAWLHRQVQRTGHAWRWAYTDPGRRIA